MEPLLKIWFPLAQWPRRWLKVIDALMQGSLLYDNITVLLDSPSESIVLFSGSL